MRISPEELEVLQSQHILMYTAKIGCFMWILCILSLLSYGKSLSSKTGTDRKLRSFELCLSSSITACFNNSSSVFTLLVSLKTIVDEELTEKWSTENFCLLFFCSWTLSFIKSLLSLSGKMLHNYLIFAHFYLIFVHFRNNSLLVAFMLFSLPSTTVLAIYQCIPLCRSELLEASVNRCCLSLQSSYGITHDLDDRVQIHCWAVPGY